MDPWRPIGDGEWVGHRSSGRFPVYTRGNAGEVYPEVFTPLSFSIAAAAGERAMRNALVASGLITAAELDEPIDVALGSGVFGGYAYLNLSTQRLLAARLPGGKPEDADRSYLGVGELPPHHELGRERDRRAAWRGMRHLVRSIRQRDLPELRADQERVRAFLATLPDVATASDLELRGTVTRLMPVFEELFERHLEVSGQAGLCVGVLSNLCERRFGDPNLAVRLLAGLGDVDSAAPSRELWTLGRAVAADPHLGAAFDAGVAGLWARLRRDPAAATFVAAVEAFIDRFGSRGPNEWDTAFDTWETDPELALALVDRLRLTAADHAPDRATARLRAERDTLEAELLGRTRGPVRPLLRRVIAAARLWSQARERTKTTVVLAIHGARLRAQELDRRLVGRSGGTAGDLWFLVEPELDGYLEDPGAFAATIAERRRMHGELARRVPPFFFAGEQPPLESWALRTDRAAAVTVGERLPGLPGCPGVARGRARVIAHPSDPAGIEPGDVLVAPLTDPSWTPLFVAAEAVVVDVGAVMSHAVIVSRELGIPCAVSVRDATRRIPDGALVEVDGGSGTVTVLALPD